jgi:hypothetical protein
LGGGQNVIIDRCYASGNNEILSDLAGELGPRSGIGGIVRRGGEPARSRLSAIVWYDAEGTPVGGSMQSATLVVNGTALNVAADGDTPYSS